MSELKPEQNISVEIVSGIEGLCLLVNDYRVAGPKPWGGGKVVHSFQAKQSQIDIALRRAQPANEPLSIAQLKQMDGEPVWCADGEGHSCYCLVNAESEDCIDSECGAWCFEFYGMTGDGENGLHNMGWLAYRRPPEMFIGVDLASGHDFTAYGRPPERSENDV